MQGLIAQKMAVQFRCQALYRRESAGYHAYCSPRYNTSYNTAYNTQYGSPNNNHDNYYGDRVRTSILG